MTSPVFLGEESKRCWLQKISNKYGDFKVAKSYKNKKGEVSFSKHKSILDCWTNDLDFMDEVNHRQVLPYEVILDLDDKDAIDKVDNICDDLNELDEEFYCFFTGSKGFHIHIIDRKLRNYPDWVKKVIREELYKLSSINFDVHKSSSKVLIAMENTPHWKTGEKKCLVRKSKWLI